MACSPSEVDLVEHQPVRRPVQNWNDTIADPNFVIPFAGCKGRNVGVIPAFKHLIGACHDAQPPEASGGMLDLVTVAQDSGSVNQSAI